MLSTKTGHILREIERTRKGRVKEDHMAEVKWIRDMETALSLAKSEGKPIVLDFFNPN